MNKKSPQILQVVCLNILLAITCMSDINLLGKKLLDKLTRALHIQSLTLTALPSFNQFSRECNCREKNYSCTV